MSEDDDWTTAIFFDAPDANANRDPAARLYARLEHVFLRWAWFAGFPTWDAAVRSLARTLRGLERADLIERHTLRTDRGQPVRRIFTLTAHGREVATLLSGGADCGEVSP